MRDSDNRLQVNLIAESLPDRIVGSDGRHTATLVNWRPAASLYDVHIRVQVAAPRSPSIQVSGTDPQGAMIAPQQHRSAPFELKKQAGTGGSHQIATDADWATELDTSDTMGGSPPQRFSRHCDTIIEVA